MTPYTVVWHQDAKDQLAVLWMKASDRNVVRLAADKVDSHLATDAESRGSPVEGDLRQLVIAPLQVLFAVSEPDRLVKVLYAQQHSFTEE